MQEREKKYHETKGEKIMTNKIQTKRIQQIVMRELGKIEYDVTQEEYKILLDTLAIVGL